MADPESPTPLLDRAQQLAQRGNSHSQILQAQKLALSAHRQISQEQIAQQNYELEQQKINFQRINMLAAIEKQKALITQQIQKTQQTTAAIDQLGRIDPNASDFSVKVAEIYKNNPMATSDPIAQEMTKSMLQSRKVVEDTSAHITEHQAAQKAILDREIAGRDDADTRAAAADAKAKESGLPVTTMTSGTEYGRTTYGGSASGELTKGDNREKAYQNAIVNGVAKVGTSEDGKNFIPLEQGATGGTHVNVSFSDPLTGKPTTELIPIDQYKSLKDSYQAPANQPSQSQPVQDQQTDQPAPIKLKFNSETGELEDGQ